MATPKSLKETLDRALARAIISGNQPFNLFTQPVMRELLHLLRPNYVPPDRHTIADKILPQLYTECRAKGISELRRIQYLNITVDETLNINLERVIVMTITTSQRSWFYTLKNMEDQELNAPMIADWIFQQLQAFLTELFGERIDWKVINSLSTDTCPLMRAVSKLLLQKPQLKHTFMIPCDSHGLQLIFKDLLDMKASKTVTVKQIFKEASEIVSFFHNSPLQYARLQKIHIKHKNRRQVLIASVITRWGSQYNLLSSVFEMKQSLLEWAWIMGNHDTKQLVEVIGTIQSSDFWLLLESLCAILKPLHIAQKESESSNANVMEVIVRWLKLQNDMTTTASYMPLDPDIKSYFTEGGFEKRAKLQLLPVYWLGYWLDPSRILQPLDAPTEEDIRLLLEPQNAWVDFLHFRQQGGPFYNATCWQAKDISIFWLEATDLAPNLASIAKRLINTIASSAAAERAFSLMNLQHTKIRNRLTVEQAEKLLFIQINEFRIWEKSTWSQSQEGIQKELLEDDEEEMARIYTQQNHELTTILNSLNSMDSLPSETGQQITPYNDL
ncbi:conserved hypothetical protein [Talaromyces stipitatus ATCC 10500]|uniref:HAT C-terminal dimerisation domain-containing protein n=1 Tax=Talaromyces stipitatus (strain ATCC 10500 / CBS 375.48 / QM 6759 / NRRL 1006) TaxID=441959 RepID=B8MP24_TALSN|nr:uncharacterized protein TSTA_104770 [Talaromyces stipitatus ATCC 10500]EED14263.1 conserved hypothetical protein [Talaromyces stipitatus ATCC 10500]